MRVFKDLKRRVKSMKASSRTDGGLSRQKGLELRGTPWISDNVLCQHKSVALSDFLQVLPSSSNNLVVPRLVHIVNLYTGNEKSMRTQRYTVDSMRRAVGGDNKVLLINVQSAAENELTPPGFIRGRDLTRTVGDIRRFGLNRNLPLLFDVLARGVELASQEDYIIYTNSDITVSPVFYECVRELSLYRIDALTINRRNIGAIERFPTNSSLPSAEAGQNHPGFDCLIFRRRLWDSFVPSSVCLGIVQVARSLLYNMVAHSNLMVMLKNVSLTYHFGDDQPWRTEAYRDYSDFNTEESLGVLRELMKTPIARSRLRQFCQNHPESEAAIETVSS